MFRKKHFLATVGMCIAVAAFSQNNVIKTGFTGAFLGDFGLSYERMLNTNGSVAVKIAYFDPTLSPFIKDKTITPEAYELTNAKGGLNTSVEYRFYMSKNNVPRGLYLAPYLRYIGQSVVFTDIIDKNHFDVNTRVNLVGAGAQIGYQLIIDDVFTMDFYFFGAGVDQYSVKLKYTLQQPQSGFDYGTITDDVTDVFEDINYFEKRLKHKVNNPNNLTSTLPFLFPGFRIGVNVGVAF